MISESDRPKSDSASVISWWERTPLPSLSMALGAGGGGCVGGEGGVRGVVGEWIEVL